MPSPLLWNLTRAAYAVGLLAHAALYFGPLPPVAAQAPAILVVLALVFSTFGPAVARHPRSHGLRIGPLDAVRGTKPWAVALAVAHLVWLAVRGGAMEKTRFLATEPWTVNAWLAVAALLSAFAAITMMILSSGDAAWREATRDDG